MPPGELPDLNLAELKYDPETNTTYWYSDGPLKELYGHLTLGVMPARGAFIQAEHCSHYQLIRSLEAKIRRLQTKNKNLRARLPKRRKSRQHS